MVTQTVAKDAPTTELLARYKSLSDPIANRVIGTITADIRSARDTPSGQNAAGEQPMGDVIADAQLAATAPSDFGGAVVAFMNPGGVRGGLLFNQISGGEQPGEVTFGEMFTVQPFSNTMVVKTCTGAADRGSARAAVRRAASERPHPAAVEQPALLVQRVGAGRQQDRSGVRSC